LAVDPMQRLRDIERLLVVTEAAPPVPDRAAVPDRAGLPDRAARRRAAPDIETAKHVDMPERIEATDGSGTVRVRLGRDGLPESIDIDADWLRVVGSEAFGSALGDAARAALDARDTAALEARRDADGDQPRPPEAADESRQPAAAHEPAAPVRPLVEVLSDAFDAMQDMTRRLAAATGEPPSGTGVAGHGKLVLTMTPDGRLSCTADPYWAADQEPAELIGALNQALAGARADLDAAMAGLSTARLADLSGQLQSALQNLIRRY
jgi:hypothetical protein